MFKLSSSNRPVDPKVCGCGRHNNPNRPHQSTQVGQAFTLVELLVVIAIIALLIGILMPVLGSARNSANVAVCLNHLRQTAIATTAYLGDSKHTYPQPDGNSSIPVSILPTALKGKMLWFNALDYYYSLDNKTYTNASSRNYKIYKQDPIYSTFGENTEVTGGNGSRTFKMNTYFGNNPAINNSYLWTRADEIRIPASTVLFYDGVAKDLGTPKFSIDSSLNTAFDGDELSIGLRHNDSANVLFADGHASTEKQPTQTRTSGSVSYKCWYAAPDTRQKYIWDFRL